MFKFAPYLLKTLWRHHTRTLLTVSGSAVALFVFCFVLTVRQGLERLTNQRTQPRVRLREKARQRSERVRFLGRVGTFRGLGFDGLVDGDLERGLDDPDGSSATGWNRKSTGSSPCRRMITR